MSPWISDLYLRSQTDVRLLSLTRDGHSRAFAILAERYRTELLAQARRLSGPGNAEDLLQQTLLSAFAALSRGAEVGHARGWLHAILRHAATRARGPVDAPLELAAQAGEAPDARLQARADARLVLAALDVLPARQREALVGSAVQGLSRAELATILGVSEGAVRQLVHRARSTVRAAISSLTPYPIVGWLSSTVGSGPDAPELAIATGAAGAGGVLTKLGMVAAAGAIAASGLAAVNHHAPRPSETTARLGAASRHPGLTLAELARLSVSPALPAFAASTVVTEPSPARLSAGVRESGGDAPGLRHPGAAAARRDGHGSLIRTDGGDGSRSLGGTSASGRDGSAGGAGGGTSRLPGGDRGSYGSSAPGNALDPRTESATGTDSGASSGGSDSRSGGSGSASGAMTTTTASSAAPSVSAATDGGGSAGSGSNSGAGSGQSTSGSSKAADGDQTAATSTTSAGSRDLSPPAGSSLPTDH